MWSRISKRNKLACKFADNHYTRQKPGTTQFVAPGRSIVLFREKALWVSLEQKFQDHAWKGAWVNTLFRNESTELSSDLIRQACAVTRFNWGVNEHGIITMIDTKKVRWKKDFGYCYLKAGFKEAGITKVHKHLVLKLFPEDFPNPIAPLKIQPCLFENYET